MTSHPVAPLLRNINGMSALKAYINKPILPLKMKPLSNPSMTKPGQSRFLPILLGCKACGAHSCLIPRRPHNNTLQNYAYLAFDSDTRLDEALKTVYSYQGYELYWTNTEEQVCFECGSPEHLLSSCPH